MTVLAPSPSHFVADLTTRQRRLRVAPSFIVSLLLHALVLSYFGHHLLTTNQLTKIDANPPLVMTLRPSSSPAVGPAAESPSPAQTHTSRRSYAESVEPRSNATAAALPDQNNPSLPIDIEAAYAVARQSGKPSRSLGGQADNSGPPDQDRETALGRGIAQAARSDCRTAHSGLGLVAIPFLIADVISDRGCKW